MQKQNNNWINRHTVCNQLAKMKTILVSASVNQVSTEMVYMDRVNNVSNDEGKSSNAGIDKLPLFRERNRLLRSFRRVDSVL